MSKLVCITKPIKELEEGVNVLQVGHICPDQHHPSPYPGTISMPCTFATKTPDECQANGVNKFEVEVDIMFDKETGQPYFELASEEIIEKEEAVIELDPKYITGQKEKREKEYKEKVDNLTLEKMRLHLNDPELNAIVDEIKIRIPIAVVKQLI